MKAVVFHGIGDVRLDEVADPRLEAETDAIIRITSSAICGTDLHLVRGTLPGMQPGTVLGHEAVGVIEELGSDVRNWRVGDRVVVPSTIACGNCAYCRHGYFSQCDFANPNGALAGTAFFGGPADSGPFQGLQAEYARIPFANIGLVRVPESVTDDQAVLLSDIFPTGYFGAEIAEIKPGDTVAVFGCGPVGQFAIVSALLLGAGRVIAIDTVPSRLAMAQAQGAETIDFNAEDPVEAIRRLTGNIGVDRAIDAVGVDAVLPHAGPAADAVRDQVEKFAAERDEIVGRKGEHNGHWVPGDGPSIVLNWAVEALAKAGTLAIIGVYPTNSKSFPIGTAMNKNLTLQMGNCPHRKYVPKLMDLVATEAVDPCRILTNVAPLTDALSAYAAFDERQAGWVKVGLHVSTPQIGFAGTT